MLTRYFVSFQLSVLITFGLFFAMQNLISSDEIVLAEPRVRPKITFIEPREILEPVDDIIQPVKEEIPTPPETKKIPSDNDVINPIAIDPIDIGIDPIVKPSGENGRAIITDSDFMVIVRPAPKYPEPLAEKGIEGFVRVQFTITKLGTTKDVIAVSSSHRGFERNAIRAAENFKFKPLIEEGEAVEVQGVYNMIEFTLEK